MDEMHIKSNFTKDLIVKAVRRIIRSKLGIDAKIDLGDIDVSIGDQTADVSLSLHGSVNKSELFKVITSLL